MEIPLLDLSGQYFSLKEEIDQRILQVLQSGQYIMGPEVELLEKNIQDFLNVKHAIAVASGSDALLLSLQALGIGQGDKVIVPTFTFFATAGAVCRLGGIPVFVDIDPETCNMDLNLVTDLLESDNKIKAIIPVHIFGLPCNMSGIMSLAQKYKVKVVEDACQAINADIQFNGSKLKAGVIGDTGCFSFFPSKNLGCFGDGGMVITNDDQLADSIRLIRVHGARPKYIHKVIGINSRLDPIQAAILNVKIKYLNEWTEKRRRVASVYQSEFDEAGLGSMIKYPLVSEGHVFHQYVIKVEHRDQLAGYLKECGIGTAVYYPEPLHVQECFSYLGYQKGDLPISEEMCNRVLALPIDPELQAEQIKYIVSSIKDFTMTML